MSNAQSTRDLSRTTAMILAGGLGTRLRTVVADRPKVLAEVLGRPFLEYLLAQLADAGVRHVILCTGFQASLVQRTLGNWFGPVRLEYSEETAPLGTGGALRLALPHVRSETILALNGDSYCDADLVGFHQHHRAHSQPGTLLLTEVADSSRYGRVQIGPEHQVAEFAEKQAAGGTGWINAGLYLLERELLLEIPEVAPVSLERDVLPRWAACGMLGAFPARAEFLDIGTPETYAQTERFFSKSVRRAWAG